MPNDNPTPPANEAPAGEDDWRREGARELDRLRLQLNTIDDRIHDLLMERATVVGKVADLARAGAKAPFRPGREAQIVRRLVGRHTGKLPAQTLFRMWRELLAGTTGMQSDIQVAVGSASLASIAREHFGTLTPMRPHETPAQALSDVASGKAAVAVLPIPTEDGDGWWTTLSRQTPRLHVIAKLPFWTKRANGTPKEQALVVGATEADASSDDRGLIVAAYDPDVSQARLNGIVAAAGFEDAKMVLRRDNKIALIDTKGYVTHDDPRFGRLVAGFRDPIVLGAYAVPYDGASA